MQRETWPSAAIRRQLLCGICSRPRRPHNRSCMPTARTGPTPVKSLLRCTCILASVFCLASCTTTSALPDPLTAGWEGEPVCERLHEDRVQRVLRCTFPPNVGHERHYHIPHFGYVVSGGRMQIMDENGVRDVDLSTGTSFSSDGVRWHEVINVGETTTVFLIVERK